jgi:hypothetical protein
MSEPSSKVKFTAEEKCCLKNSATAGFSFIDLSSPYLRKTARDGSKHMIGEVVSSSRSTILSNPVEETRITPDDSAYTGHRTHKGTLNSSRFGDELMQQVIGFLRRERL